MRITMKDVAQRADISIKTVSRVVNGEGEISEETIRRVQEVIDELGYRPNRMARGLVNVDLFKAANIPIPSLTDRMTTQQFQDLAVKLSSGDGASAFLAPQRCGSAAGSSSSATISIMPTACR